MPSTRLPRCSMGRSRQPGGWRTIRAGPPVSPRSSPGGPARPYSTPTWPGPGRGHEVTAAQLLGRASADAFAVESGLSLYAGLAGVVWMASHLETPGEEADALCRTVDGRLPGELERSPWDGDYDLLYGLVGLGVYALERLPRPSAANCLEWVVARLAEQARDESEGVTWWTSPALTRSPELYPRSFYCLGLAHGLPGVIALLGLTCAAGVARSAARPLLDAAVAWLLSRKLPEGAGSTFPALPRPGEAPVASRLAWCYGDLGVSAALLVAARAVGEPVWEREALATAVAAAERPPERSGVVDAPLCYGAIGVAHVFNRLYQATGEPRLATAARCWYERGLAMRRPHQKLAGFSAMMPGADGSRRPVASRGLLNGAVGIGLALLAAITPIEPAWDRVLLVSGRSARRGA